MRIRRQRKEGEGEGCGRDPGCKKAERVSGVIGGRDDHRMSGATAAHRGTWGARAKGRGRLRGGKGKGERGLSTPRCI